MINKLLKPSVISEILSGSKRTIYADRIPKIHEHKIQELNEACEAWIKKYSKK